MIGDEELNITCLIYNNECYLKNGSEFKYITKDYEERKSKNLSGNYWMVGVVLVFFFLFECFK
jgi:hypothetical protein